MAKVKNDWKIRETFKEWQKESKRLLPRFFKDEIVNESILKGKSPVKGDGRYEKYSDAYRKQIRGRSEVSILKSRRISPVNLKLTGKLIKSFKVTDTKNGVKISFTDEKAVYHDEGQGNLPQRKLLPTRRGESFTPSILLRLKQLLDRALSNVRRGKE